MLARIGISSSACKLDDYLETPVIIAWPDR